MEHTHCIADAKQIQHFLNCCGGNWHNCVYVRCTACKAGVSCSTSDFLYHPDKNGAPCILPMNDARLLFSRTPEAEECCAVLTLPQFLTLYQAYLAGQRLTDTSCPCTALLRLQESTHYDW